MFEFLGLEALSDAPLSLPTSSAEWVINTPYLVYNRQVNIEYLAGDVRRKVRADGSVIENLFVCAYGEILNTTDRTGERLDVYLAEPFFPDAPIIIIDQVDPSTRIFDEHKLMFGFASKEAALAAYEAVFSDGSGLSRIGAMSLFDHAQFDEWMENPDHLLVPASMTVIPGVTIFQGPTPIKLPTAPPSAHTKPVTMVKDGAVLIGLPRVRDGLVIHTKTKGEAGMSYQIYIYGPVDEDTFVEPMFQLTRLLDDASADDEFVFHISTPGGDVICGGVLTAAMRSTAASVTTIAEGPVCSCGVTIWSEGKTRVISPGSYFMQHFTSGGMGGNTGTLSEKIEFTKNYVLDYMGRLVVIGLFTQEEITDMVSREAQIFISGEEAIRRVGGATTND